MSADSYPYVTREAVMAVRCRFCGSPAGKLCVDRERDFNQRLWDPHGSRVVAFWTLFVKGRETENLVVRTNDSHAE